MSEVEHWLEETLKPLTTLDRIREMPDMHERFGALSEEYCHLFREKLKLQEEANDLKAEMDGMLGITIHQQVVFVCEWEDDPGPKECGAGRRNPATQHLVVVEPGLYSIDIRELLQSVGLSTEQRAAGMQYVTRKGDEVWIEFY